MLSAVDEVLLGRVGLSVKCRCRSASDGGRFAKFPVMSGPRPGKLQSADQSWWGGFGLNSPALTTGGDN